MAPAGKRAGSRAASLAGGLGGGFVLRCGMDGSGIEVLFPGAGGQVGGEGDTAVEDEEFAVPVLATGVFEVVQHAAVKLDDVVVAVGGHPEGRLLAADATGAVGDDAFAGQLGAVGLQGGRQFGELGDVRVDGAVEVADLDLEVVAGVDDGDVAAVVVVAFVDPAGQGLGRDGGGAAVGRADAGLAEGDGLALDLHQEAVEALLVRQTFLDVHVGQRGQAAQHVGKGAGVVCRPAQHDVDAFGGEQDGATHVQAATFGQQVGAQPGQVVEVGKLVGGQVQVGVRHDGRILPGCARGGVAGRQAGRELYPVGHRGARAGRRLRHAWKA